jgi:hypothetical protein
MTGKGVDYQTDGTDEQRPVVKGGAVDLCLSLVCFPPNMVVVNPFPICRFAELSQAAISA